MVNTSDLKSDAPGLDGSIPSERTITYCGTPLIELPKDKLIECIRYLMEYDTINKKSYNEHIFFLERQILRLKIRYTNGT